MELNEEKSILANLYLNNVDVDSLGLDGRMPLNEKVKEIEIPGLGDEEVAAKISEEYKRELEAERELENEIEKLYAELDDIIFDQYSLDEKQRKLVISDLEARRSR